MRDFGRSNTLGTLILPHIAFSLPFANWMLRRFLKGVPEALAEAAHLDAASRARFLWQILFPLVLPGMVATSVFSFISAWNDFLFAKSFVIIDSSQSKLPMALPVFCKPDDGLGRGDGRFDGDDDSGAGVLRTRTATAGLRAGRSGQGLR